MSGNRPGIGWFAREVLKKPLYPYQEEVGDAIINSVLEHKGLTFSVMFGRQMGKNQLSAVLEAYLLACMPSGTMVKAAPTWKPQIINSRLRLLSMMENPFMQDRIWKSFGYIIGLAPTPEMREAQAGPRIFLFSAGPEANIVGATANILLEIDEAQDVSVEKYDRDLRPMASTANSTTILYGTAWSDDTLLAITKAHNLELEQEDGIKRHFEFDWRTLAAINPNYDKFVRNEIQRLGEDHITIRTQYRLLTISGAGFLLNDAQRHLLRGSHDWQNEPDPDGEYSYVIGCDIGGEERPKPGEENKPSGKRDSTIITVGRVGYNEFDLPKVEIVHQYWFTGMHHIDQYAAICAIIQTWEARRLVIDATGVGEALASLLIDKFGDDRITAFKFSRPSKSKLTFHFLSMINSSRLKIYQEAEAPSQIYEECMKQLRLAKYSVPGEGLINMMVDPENGHDDFLMSVALCAEATREFTAPVQQSIIVRPRRLYSDGRY